MSSRMPVLVTLWSVLGCADAGGAAEGDTASFEEPWTIQFIMGNFSVNTAEIATNQDGVSFSRLNDYVFESDLPDGDLEVFTTHAYLPTAGSAGPEIVGAEVTVGLLDASRSGDIYRDHEHVEDVTLGDQTYAVFRVTGFIAADPPLTRTTFANVVFELAVEYRADGEVADASTKALEIYKR